MKEQSREFVTKVAIALVVVLMVAGMLYYMQRRNTIDDETEMSEHLTAEPIPNPGGSENKIASERISYAEPSNTDSAAVITQLEPPVYEPVSDDVAAEFSATETETSTRGPKVRIEGAGSALASPDGSTELATRFEQEANSEANAKAWRTTEIASDPESELPEVPSKASRPPSQTELPHQRRQLPPSIRSYSVKQGDTLYAIAKETYGDGRYWRAIYDANREIISDPGELRATWKLELPPADEVVQDN